MKSCVLFAFLSLAGAAVAQRQTRNVVPLPSSKKLLLPVPGDPWPTSSFTETLALSPDGQYLAFLNNGFGSRDSGHAQSIGILDLTNKEITDFPDARFAYKAQQSLFVGLAFSADGTHVYASVGSLSDPEGKQKGNLGNGIAVYGLHDGKLAPERFIPITLQPGHGKEAKTVAYPAGLAVIPASQGEQLLVANDLADNALLLDAATGSVIHSFDLSHSQAEHAAYPYDVVATKDGKHGYVSLWNASSVVELDLAGGKVGREVKLAAPKLPTQSGSHPTAMALSSDEKTLYVALANVDQVAVVDTASMTSRTMLSTTIDGQKYAGSYPVGLALSPDNSRLYVANAGTNSVAVFDPSAASNRPGGFIPTDWYPTALVVTGDDLWIATAKGTGTGPNPVAALTSQELLDKNAYIPSLLHGSLAHVSTKRIEEDILHLTGEVRESNLITSRRDWSVFPPDKANPIKHVIYILKENRTYDQILGDLGVGNGDPSLVLYGKDVTPNQHKLALQFGVLDNFYDSGEVSGNGHLWSMAAVSGDYTEKTWQIVYRGKERTEDFYGRVADAYPFLQGIPDVNEPGTGYLWTNLARNGRTYRHYAEYIDSRWCDEPNLQKPDEENASKDKGQNQNEAACRQKVIARGEALPANVGRPHGSLSPWPWGVPVLLENIATKPELRGHYDEKFPDFNTRYPDQLRADEFLNEFEGFVAARKSGTGTMLPEFILLRLPNDHTEGTRPGGPRPAASVADNDLAVGRVVDAVSHSPYWDDTAIFIVEDDAQNGGDHVDAHRSIAFVISKYSPGSAEKPYVEHGFYTTVSLVTTMESLLGLPPMNLNDAYAPLLTNLFRGADQPPFTADDSNLKNGLLYQVNPPNAAGAKQSEKMDFSHADAVDAVKLNAILWRDRRGSARMPKSMKSSVGD